MSIWKVICISAIILLLVIFFGMWRYTALKLDTTEKDLAVAKANVQTLEKDKAKLLEYNLQKENEIKDITHKYEELQHSIPADACGDAKPSPELLLFLKGATNNGTAS